MSEKAEWLRRGPDVPLARRLRAWAWAITAAVLILVAAMRKIHIPLPEGVDLLWLPPLYSSLNALAAVLLVVAGVAIGRGNVRAHRAAITAALAVSVLFLLGYVAYHFTTSPTKFGGEGAIWWIYILLLASHIILAAFSFPFILFAYISGLTNHFERHRRLVRWIYPIWLYVAISGPICYLMLRPYYGT